MSKRTLTVRVQLWFDDLAAESSQDAVDAVKQALAEMHVDCHAQLSDALEAIGAKDVRMDTQVI